MAFLLRQGVIAISLGVLLFCMSCEKRPLGQFPELQREQPDPAKVWSQGKRHTGEPSDSNKPTEAHEAP